MTAVWEKKKLMNCLQSMQNKSLVDRATDKKHKLITNVLKMRLNKIIFFLLINIFLTNLVSYSQLKERNQTVFPPLRVLPASITTPSATATTGVPLRANISIPSCFRFPPSLAADRFQPIVRASAASPRLSSHA